MHYRIAALVLALAALAAGCTTATGTPATAPPLPEPVPATPGTLPPTTTTTVATTTTVDRLAEIQAIYEDLEHRRLQAIFDQDEEAFRSVYANVEYLRESLQLFDTIVFLESPGLYPVQVLEIITDEANCVSAIVQTDLTAITEGGQLAVKQQAIQLKETGWGISYTGEDWNCVGPHPFSG
jgi:ABC-type transport system substrate-binding protein